MTHMTCNSFKKKYYLWKLFLCFMLVYYHTKYEMIFIALLCEVIFVSGLVLCHFIDVIFMKKL